ncbi:hypothetical protein Slin15195_G072070 [Septoria linicola]|uniref:Uncharacterized protein n=1 Tax=Septoria linicola TaxID=215465 RepID=A0A9Q9AVC8_9PEZI|nr:hypothetical protein Slin14017_G104820 [Septoria linicola]USW53888.1 hypothetical protein Slin15195_G072070 [Septoria linicola]
MSDAYSESSEEVDLLADDRYTRYSNHSSLVLHTLLPALHRRLSKLRSLRQVLPYSASRAQHRHSSSLSNESEASITPPPSYKANGHGIDTHLSQPAIVSWMEHTADQSAAPSRQSFSGSTTPTCVGDSGQGYAEQSESGVQWRYADPGYASLLLAQSEIKRASSSPSFVRRQYISGVICLLRGLPEELSVEEEQNLREALPITLRPTRYTEQQLASLSNMSSDRSRVRPRSQRSLLQQWVALGTLHLFLAAVFVFPYLQNMVQKAYRFDRRHQLSDQLLAQGIDAMGTIKRRTQHVATHICAMNDGKVGEQLKDASMYMILGVSGGMCQGLGEGMQVLGSRSGKEQ